MTKTRKFVAYSSAAIGAVLIGLLGYALGWLHLASDPVNGVTGSAKSVVPLIQEPTRDLQHSTPTQTKSLSVVSTSPRPQPSVEPKSLYTDKALPSAARAAGKLRVSNRTPFPLRLALLSQRVSANLAKQAGNLRPNPVNFREPTHWDFDPEEGSGKGLILSLPEGDIKLIRGDILVAFAQDGSRRYWGPYVVGETAIPAWNREATEWQLVLNP